jgi:hypothetical protein
MHAIKPQDTFNPTVILRFVDETVAWFLRDPTHWSRLVRRYRVEKKPKNKLMVRDGKIEMLEIEPARTVHLPIERQPPGLGVMWAKTFWSVYKMFKTQLAAIGEEERWTSFSLSYMALRRCVVRGKYQEFSYVYAACKNAHTAYLKRHEWPHYQPLDNVLDLEPGPDWEAIDLGMDFEEVLATMEPRDAEICRMRLVEDRTFEEISQWLGGVDRSNAKRRYDRCLPAIQSALSDYEPGPATTTLPGQREAA